MTAMSLQADPGAAPISSAVVAASPSVVHERYHYRTVSLDGSTAGGTATLELTRRGDLVDLVEERQLPDGNRMTFKVRFSSRDMQVMRWEMQVKVDGQVTRSTLAIGRAEVEAKQVGPDGVTTSDRMTRPKGTVVMTPLLKFELARRLDQGHVTGPLEMIVLRDGELESYRLQIEDRGDRQVTTAAGTFRCRVLSIAPTSALLALAVPPGEMLLAADGSHPLVLGVGSISRLSKVMRTELIEYRSENATP